jgi:hypothetical protein
MNSFGMRYRISIVDQELNKNAITGEANGKNLSIIYRGEIISIPCFMCCIMVRCRPLCAGSAASGEPGLAPPPAPHRACAQQCQALSPRQRPDPPLEAGRPGSGDGTVLCPAQLPSAPDSVAANDLIGINSFIRPRGRGLASSDAGGIKYLRTNAVSSSEEDHSRGIDHERREEI